MVINGMDRICISTGNLSHSLAFYRDWVGMEVIAEQQRDAEEIQPLFNLPEGTGAHSVVLKQQHQQTMLELLQFQPNSGRPIRDGARIWDYGICDIAFLVSDMDGLYRELLEQGFSFVSPPVHYRPEWSPNEIKQAIMIGPDMVPIAHFERISGDTQKTDIPYLKLTHSAQIVDDMSRVITFYRDILGFDLVKELSFSKGLIDELLGLPPGVEGTMAFFNKKDKAGLLMEFLQLSIPGSPLSVRETLPNLGLWALCFEVSNMEALLERLKKENIPVLSEPVQLRVEPHGTINVVTVQGPVGVMIELFEK